MNKSQEVSCYNRSKLAKISVKIERFEHPTVRKRTFARKKQKRIDNYFTL